MGFDIASKKTKSQLSEMGIGVIEVDGITQYKDDSFLVSLIDEPKIWILQAGESARPFRDIGINGIDMEFVQRSQTLFIPRVGNTPSAYRVLQSE